MTVTGTYELGPSNGTLTVHTSRAGMAAKAGHDLVLAPTSWSASLTIDEGAPERSQLELRVDATQFEVREGVGGVKPLSDSDREEIVQNIARKVLHSDKHPEIAFVSNMLRDTGDGTISAAGDLTVAGQTQPVRVALILGTDGDGPTVSASVTLLQSRFGIKPYSALMGTLKVADEITIQAEARLRS